MAAPLLQVVNLHAEIAEEGTEILRGVDLEIGEGEIHAIMGPNGSGKSTLSKVISGHPSYEVTDGDILFRGESILDVDPAERAQSGIFLAFQDPTFAERSVNEGFSGGEKKRNEILQLALLEPTLAVMDETDSGLDIDALKVVSAGINKIKSQHQTDMAVLLITHYQRMLNYVKPDYVHVMVDGRIIRSGGPELALELEEKGYEQVRGLATA